MSTTPRRKRRQPSSRPPLVDSDFMKIIAAWSPSASRRIFSLMEQYQKLLAFGWTIEEVELAVAVGYNVETHVVCPDSKWQWKYGCDAKPFYEWVRHYYQRYRAEELGISFEAFTALWRSLADRDTRPQITYTSGGGTRIPDIQELLTHYMHARQHGLSDYEIRYEFFHYLDRAESYLFLRRKLGKDFVKKILWESRGQCWSLDEKAVIEARSRGASHEEILDSVKSNNTHELALTLRRRQRAIETQEA